MKVARVYPEKNLILVKGAIPGPKRALVTITDAAKA
jgi:large subunit ribosomal protein L3